MPQRTSKILLVRLTANKNASLFQIRVTCFARYTVWFGLYTTHCTLYSSELYTMHCLTKIRFALVLRNIHLTLDDKLHFWGICIVMNINVQQFGLLQLMLDTCEYKLGSLSSFIYVFWLSFVTGFYVDRSSVSYLVSFFLLYWVDGYFSVHFNLRKKCQGRDDYDFHDYGKHGFVM